MKPIYNIDGRQDVKAAVFEVTEADFRLNANVVKFEAEPGSVLVSARLKAVQLFDGTADTVAFGTEDDTDRYGASHNLKSATAVVVTPDDAVLGAAPVSNVLVLTRTATGTPTAGVGRLRVIAEFVKIGKADTTQGNDSAPTVPPNPGPHY